MTDRPDAIRDLVWRAHQTDPDNGQFDTAAGLADLHARATQRAIASAPEDRHAKAVPHERALRAPKAIHADRTGTGRSVVVETSEDVPAGFDRLGSDVDRFDGSPWPAVPAVVERWSDEGLRDEPEALESQRKDSHGQLIRPYIRTGGRGRHRSHYDLAIEALVSTSDRGRLPEAAVLPEHRAICGLCLDTHSVAEIAAHLRLPVGVVRVLIGDMTSMGLVVVHQSGLTVGERPSIELMERVLTGLRNL